MNQVVANGTSVVPALTPHRPHPPLLSPTREEGRGQVQETQPVTSPPETAPYGTWRSPITTDLITGKRVGVVSPRIDGDDAYWIENRPAEAGRSVVVRRAEDGTISDAIPGGFNARTRVHEYGGGAYTVRNGVLIFANFAD